MRILSRPAMWQSIHHRLLWSLRCHSRIGSERNGNLAEIESEIGCVLFLLCTINKLEWRNNSFQLSWYLMAKLRHTQKWIRKSLHWYICHVSSINHICNSFFMDTDSIGQKKMQVKDHLNDKNISLIDGWWTEMSLYIVTPRYYWCYYVSK